MSVVPMIGVLYVVVDSARKGVEMFRWGYGKETSTRYRGGDSNAPPHYRTLIKKSADGVPEKLYRRSEAEAITAYVDDCNEQAQQCRDIESAFIVRAKAAQALGCATWTRISRCEVRP